MPFAVIDFETTGLVPERTDRVVEIGVVLTDDNGHIEHEWTTLVNPHRDVGHLRSMASLPEMSSPHPILQRSATTSSK
jgi:DNA polymerase III epsilon subunit-like protein